MVYGGHSANGSRFLEEDWAVSLFENGLPDSVTTFVYSSSYSTEVAFYVHHHLELGPV